MNDQAPMSLTLEEAIRELSSRVMTLECYPGDKLTPWQVYEGARIQGSGATWPEAFTDATGKPVVARDDAAAELRAALESAYSRFELIRTAYDRGFDRAYIEGCAGAGADETHATLHRLAGEDNT